MKSHAGVRRGRLVVTLASAALIWPATSSAATVSVRYDGLFDFARTTAEYEAAPGEANRLSVTAERPPPGTDSGEMVVTLVDVVGITPGPGCVRPDPADPSRAQCSLKFGASTFASGVDAQLGDGDDTATADATATPTFDGGPGNDTLDAPEGAAVFKGGPGDDAMTGGPLTDFFYEDSAFANGTDTIDGAVGGDDRLSYIGRKRRVRVSLDGRRNDGGSGEQDLVVGAIHYVAGGRAGDRLIGGNGDDILQGMGGDDSLIGGKGADTLTGWSGADALIGGPGPDTMFARHGGRDEVRCGAGRDTARIDRSDSVKRDCERVSRRR